MSGMHGQDSDPPRPPSGGGTGGPPPWTGPSVPPQAPVPPPPPFIIPPVSPPPGGGQRRRQPKGAIIVLIVCGVVLVGIFGGLGILASTGSHGGDTNTVSSGPLVGTWTDGSQSFTITGYYGGGYTYTDTCNNAVFLNGSGNTYSGLVTVYGQSGCTQMGTVTATYTLEDGGAELREVDSGYIGPPGTQCSTCGTFTWHRSS